MNKRGSDGIINCTGKPGAPSELVDCRDADFLRNIEDGIISTVVAITGKGLYTLSSCQGHAASCPYRCVSVVHEISVIQWLQQAVYAVNRAEAFRQPITYYLLDYPPECGLYAGCFQDPRVIDVNFGDFRDSETVRKQGAFERYLETHPVSEIFGQLSPEITRYRMCSDDHVDVFKHTDADPLEK